MKKTLTAAIILAAGVGSRMNLGFTKQKLEILGESLLFRSLKAFDDCPDIDFLIVVTRPGEEDFVSEEISKGIRKPVKTVYGGNTRAESAKNGFYAIPKECNFVAIHDAARCLITPQNISKILKDAEKYGAATASMRVHDSVKKIDSDGFVERSENRDYIILAQTPQIFSVDLYEKAIDGIDFSDPLITDDNSLLERIGVRVYATETGKTNIKITEQSDVFLAECYLKGGKSDV